LELLRIFMLDRSLALGLRLKTVGCLGRGQLIRGELVFIKRRSAGDVD
jgi:hypothetical protein